MDRSVTSLTLLESLHDSADQGAWQRFDDCYRPLVVRFARQLVLGARANARIAQQNADAAEQNLAAIEKLRRKDAQIRPRKIKRKRPH